MIDVGLAFGPSAKKDGLIQPYKVATWSTIPDTAKDADGSWYGDYYGVLTFEVNKDIIKKSPTDWPDLLGPDYKNAVALAGDPRVSSQAIQGVLAAGLSAAGGDMAKAPDAGLKFFADLNKKGNFVPVIGKASSVAQGSTPLAHPLGLQRARRSRHAEGQSADRRGGAEDAACVAGVYVQAISAFAPHPNAAKLWMEYLYSDEGQIGCLKGYCHPIRFQNLVESKKVPADLLAKLPPAEGYAKAVFPTLDQLAVVEPGDHQAMGQRGRREREVSGPNDNRAEAPGCLSPLDAVAERRPSPIRLRRREARGATST